MSTAKDSQHKPDTSVEAHPNSNTSMDERLMYFIEGFPRSQGYDSVLSTLISLGFNTHLQQTQQRHYSLKRWLG